MIFRLRFLFLVGGISSAALNVTVSLYPLSFRALLYSGLAWSNISLLHESRFSLLLTDAGSCLVTVGG